MPETLYIRADANAAIGAGHVMRCLALANACAETGGRVVFVGEIEGEGLRQRLAAAGCPLVPPVPGLDPASGEGCRAALVAAGARAGDRVVLDGYHFGPECQRILREAGFVALVLDDTNALPAHHAHAVLNQDPASSPAAYPQAPGTLILTGPCYRLLRREFAQPRECRMRDAAHGARVLVTFGGADSGNASRAVLDALRGVLGAQDMVRVVVGPVNRHRASLEDGCARAGFVCELLDDVRDMPALMAWADLAVSASGGTAWELAALGVPTVLVPVADNQAPGARMLEQAGAAVSLAGPAALGEPEFPALVRSLLDDCGRREAMSLAGRELCDGCGAARALEVLDTLAGLRDGFVLREAGPDDAEQIFRLANDPDTRRFAFSPDPVRLEDHLRWYAARMAVRDETAIYVLCCATAVAAEVRYDKSGDTAAIDVAVHAAFRGRGLGPRILVQSRDEACRRLGVSRLRAEVFTENGASRRCFEKAGFILAGEEMIKGRRCVVYTWEIGQ